MEMFLRSQKHVYSRLDPKLEGFGLDFFFACLVGLVFSEKR